MVIHRVPYDNYITRQWAAHIPSVRNEFCQQATGEQKKMETHSWFRKNVSSFLDPRCQGQVPFEVYRSLEPLIQRLAEKPELEECECDEGDGGDERGRGRGSITTYTVMSSTARETMAQKPKAGRTTKIRVYPTVCQRRILDEWFRGSRFIYNHALASIKRR